MTEMIERQIDIVNRKGLHARASAKLAKVVIAAGETVTVSHEGESADARSIMDLLMLAAHKGASVNVRVEGENADETMTKIEALISDGFGELSEDAEPPK